MTETQAILALIDREAGPGPNALTQIADAIRRGEHLMAGWSAACSSVQQRAYDESRTQYGVICEIRTPWKDG